MNTIDAAQIELFIPTHNLAVNVNGVTRHLPVIAIIDADGFVATIQTKTGKIRRVSASALTVR